jgi:hypothetical protein
MDGRGVGIGDAIDTQSSLVGKGDLNWTTVCSRPKNRFAVLGESVEGHVGNSVDASGGSFDPATLRHADQN